MKRPLLQAIIRKILLGCTSRQSFLWLLHKKIVRFLVWAINKIDGDKVYYDIGSHTLHLNIQKYINKNEWTHLAGTYSFLAKGKNKSGKHELYINGEPKDTLYIDDTIIVTKELEDKWQSK